jgi:hypothetical protein
MHVQIAVVNLFKTRITAPVDLSYAAHFAIRTPKPKD